MTNPPMEAEKFHVWLKDAGGCVACRSWSRGKDLRTIWDTCQRGDWLAWLLNACGYQWTALALAEYERVTAPAWAEYERVTAPALAEYERVTAPALAEYERVTAPALAEYKRVTADAIRTLIPYPFSGEVLP